jgi:hypothetical protein
MPNQVNQGFTVSDLEIQKIGLEDRIKRLESDLKSPLDMDLSEQAGQVSNRIILLRLLEVERSNLSKISFEINNKRQNIQK